MMKIKRLFSTPYHAQTNEQVEVVNKIIKYTLKAKLEDKKGKWAANLPNIQWAYKTTTRNSTDDPIRPRLRRRGYHPG